jgi:large subunit ribosomal protein L6
MLVVKYCVLYGKYCIFKEFTVSRVGKMPVPIPAGVTISFEGNKFTAKGPKGELTIDLTPELKFEKKDEQIIVSIPSNSNAHRSLHGLFRTLINNAIVGVTEGYEKRLEIIGVGYRADLKQNRLKLLVGYSHPIVFAVPEGIHLELSSPTNISVKGIDKQLVGQVAAKIRSFRPPEPYKGKGIRYEGEYVRKKAGKAAA